MDMTLHASIAQLTRPPHIITQNKTLLAQILLAPSILTPVSLGSQSSQHTVAPHQSFWQALYACIAECDLRIAFNCTVVRDCNQQ